jgi:hypothetical protein
MLRPARKQQEQNRWASDSGLCWFADSRRILFSSFDDESLYLIPDSEVRGNISYSICHATNGQFESSLYVFETENGVTTRFGVVSPSGEMILAGINRHSPFLAAGRLVLFQTESPGDWHLLDEEMPYRVDWTNGDSTIWSQLVSPPAE